MKGLTTILCLGMACALSSAAFAFAGCKTEKDEELSYTQAVYQKYLAYAEAIGEEPKSYEDWLATIKGEDGAPGEPGAPGTPGAPGKDGTMWYTGTLSDRDSNEDVKTGDIWLDTETFDIYTKTEEDWLKLGNLKGQNGKDASQIFTGDSLDGSKGKDGDYFLLSNGDLFIKQNGSYTKCFSLKGPAGSPGSNGSTWFASEGTPDKATGVDGDFCLDTVNLIIYKKTSNVWVEVCKLQTSAPAETSTVKNGTQFDVPGEKEEQGWYKVLLKTGSTALADDQLKAIRVDVTNKGKNTSYKLFTSSFEKSAESTDGNNIYFAVIPEYFNYDSGFKKEMLQDKTLDRKVEFSGITDEIEGEVEIKKWVPSALSALDTEFDFFCPPIDNKFGSSWNDAYKTYQEYYGGENANLSKPNMCVGAAFFFDSTLYSQISGKTLLLQYGDGTVNKFPSFATSPTGNYYWVGDKSGKQNAFATDKTSWDYLATEGFTYLTIESPESNSDKYFFELCGKSSKTYGDVNYIVPMKLKVSLKT